MINVSELIEDPDFCQPKGISITRSFYTVQNHKPVLETEDIVVPGIIITSAENSDELLPEADRNSEQIHVYTYDRLKTVGVDSVDGKKYSADIINYNNKKYVVRYCLNHSQFGYCRSTAVKIEPGVM